jgi:hypothetical protein
MSAPVNSQITDAVTQANVKVLGDAPPMALSQLYQVIGGAIDMCLDIGLTRQQIADTMMQAAADEGISLLYKGEIPEKGLTDQQVIDYLRGIIKEHTDQLSQ